LDLEKVAATRQVLAGTGLTGGGALNADVTISMPAIGTAGTYGSSTQVPVFTTDAQGRITSVTNTNISLTSNNILIDLLSEINLIPFEQNNAIRSNINVVNNFYVHDNDMYNNISNINDIIINNKIEFLTISDTIQIDQYNNYIIRNKICYPDSMNGIEKYDEFSYNYNSNILNNKINYYYDYTYILTKNINSSNLFNKNNSNFYLINYKSVFPTLNSSSFINYNLNLYVEKNEYNIDYIDTIPVLQKSPYFRSIY
jgi:hypothetical protein